MVWSNCATAYRMPGANRAVDCAGRWDGIADLVIEKRVSESLLASFDLKGFLYISV